MRGQFITGMPEQYRRHWAMKLFGWSYQQYLDAPASVVDWAFAIESAEAEVSEKKQAAQR